ncbi:hypothetical protein NDN08_000121 [Rhodosorus marinus]|uniref:Enoyl reductase (ER) domain-containing protein n=1 Tax=Rhodosorus marinus TaxID=101924 RepID=A0AAV8UHQ4_9RHOD|nr:hypothetical protein NDN08_000121 [Rhodosorus marinus]
MRALVRSETGDLDTYDLKADFELPPLDEGQVLVKVFTTSVNPIDSLRRRIMLTVIGGPPDVFPVVDGYDLCGEVVRVGPGAEKFSVGQKVFGNMQRQPHRPQQFGAWAEYANVYEDTIAALPEGLDPAIAGCVGVTFGTCIEAVERSDPASTRSVLITGGAGGVGSAMVQIAKHVLNSEFIAATASTSKVEEVGRIGANKVVDYKTTDLVQALEGNKFDFILDTVGEGEKCLTLLAEDGKYVQLTGAAARDPRATFLLHGGKTNYYERLSPYLASGKMKPIIHQVVPFAEYKRAIELAESGGTMGKIVMEIARS